MAYLRDSLLPVFIRVESQLDTARRSASFGMCTRIMLAEIASCVRDMEGVAVSVFGVDRSWLVFLSIIKAKLDPSCNREAEAHQSPWIC